MTDKYIAPWRKELRPASFRGVPFFVKNAQSQFGRRVVVHEFPQRDQSLPEDMGKKDDAFTIEAVVIGPDYFKARDALIKALKEKGPGTLVHPFYGERIVVLTSPAQLSESFDEGGKARFTLEFIEAAEAPKPKTREDTLGKVKSAASAAKLATVADFAKNFSLAGALDFVQLDALGMMNGAMGSINGLTKSLVPDISMLSDYANAAGGLMGSVSNLIRMPASLAQNVLGMLGGVTALAKNPLSAFNAYKGLFSYGNKFPSVAKTTPARTMQANNQAAIVTLTQRAVLIEAAEVAASVPFESYEQATSARDDLASRLDDTAAGIPPVDTDAPEEIESREPTPTPSEDVYVAFTALRVAVARHLTEQSINAPRVMSVTMQATQPALLMAYRVYGDARRVDELIGRNARKIRHPGFAPGGVPLEVLKDETKGAQ